MLWHLMQTEEYGHGVQTVVVSLEEVAQQMLRQKYQ